MSWFSKFVYDPIVARIARASGSSNAGVAEAAKSLQATVAQTSTDVNSIVAGGLTANSATALKNVVVKDLEDGLKAAVDAFLMGAVPLGMGGVAVPLANAALDFAENHAHDYVASLFHHAKARVAVAPTTVTTT